MRICVFCAILTNNIDWELPRIGENRNVYRVLVEKLEGKGPFGRPRSRMVDNIEVDLEEMRAWVGLNWLRMGTSGRLL